MSNNPIHSTGRGGAGNIGPDPNTYVDAGIVREGPEGESADGAFSTGRGGAGNVGSPRASPHVGPSPGHENREHDYIPETSLRPHQENFHTGRGGEGNIHREKYGGHSSPQHSPKQSPHVKPTIGDKVKHALHLDKHEKSPLSNKTEP